MSNKYLSGKGRSKNFKMDSKERLSFRLERTSKSETNISPRQKQRKLDLCAICLNTDCENRCQVFPCNHEYCYPCILQWSQIKNRCPLCNQVFTSIMHNIESDCRYDIRYVPDATQIKNDWLEASIRNIHRAVQSMLEDFSDAVNTAIDTSPNIPALRPRRSSSPTGAITAITRIIEEMTAERMARNGITTNTPTSSISTTGSIPSLPSLPSIPLSTTSAPVTPSPTVVPSLTDIPSITDIPSTSESVVNFASETDLDQEWDILW